MPNIIDKKVNRNNFSQTLDNTNKNHFKNTIKFRIIKISKGNFTKINLQKKIQLIFILLFFFLVTYLQIEEPWDCNVCTFVNIHAATICEMCEAKKFENRNYRFEKH